MQQLYFSIQQFVHKKTCKNVLPVSDSMSSLSVCQHLCFSANVEVLKVARLIDMEEGRRQLASD